jgi:hypothetical protein
MSGNVKRSGYFSEGSIIEKKRTIREGIEKET